MSIDICKDIDPKRANTEMIEVYATFIESPEDIENYNKIFRLNDFYSGSEDYIPYTSATNKAIMWLSGLLQSGQHEFYTVERCLKEAKEILQKLKEEKK